MVLAASWYLQLENNTALSSKTPEQLVCWWLQAAWAAVQVYLDLDRRSTSSADHAEDGDAAASSLSPEELKKLKQRRRKVRSWAIPLAPCQAAGPGPAWKGDQNIRVR